MRLYRIDYFLAEKADKEHKTIQEVITELRKELDISSQVFSKLRNAEYSNTTRVSSHLLNLSFFFNCPMDSLVNPAVKDQIGKNHTHKD